MSKQRKCVFCGKEYSYCPHCGTNSSPGWMMNFDSIECRDIYNVLAGYNMGLSSADDVKAELDKYHITDYSVFSKKIQDKLMEIVSKKKEESKVESTVEKESKPKEEKNNFNKNNNKKKFEFNKKQNTEE